MKRFIIIDHSLCNLQGHHYECSVSIARAAIKRGYEAIIVSNRAFLCHLHPEDITILPWFEVDWFDHGVTQVSSENLTHRQSSFGHLNDYINDWSIKQPKFRVLLEKIQGSTTRLRQGIGKDIQHLTYLPFANTLWGIFKIIWGVVRYGSSVLVRKIRDKVINKKEVDIESFSITFNRVLDTLKISIDDHILVHTLGISQVEDIYHILRERQKETLPQVHLLLRRDIEDPLVIYAKGMGLKNCLSQFAASQLWPDKVHFYTDTEDLVKRHNSLSPVQFRQVPVPFSTDELKVCSSKSLETPIHIVYLGDARYEKGYHHFPQVIDELWEDYLKSDKIKLTLQSNFSIAGGEGELLKVRLQLEQYPSRKVRLIKEALGVEDYYQLLLDADIIILPYDTYNYRYRTSGVLTEALAAGKPVIVPDHTWLGQQIDQSRGRRYNHPSEIGNKVKEVIENLEEMTLAAEGFRWEWLEKNTPETFLNCLLSPQENQLIEKKGLETVTMAEVTSYSFPHVLFIIGGNDLTEETPQRRKLFQHWHYLFNSGYRISIITFSPLPSYQQGNYEVFYHQVRPVLERFQFTHIWILDHHSYPCLPEEISPEKYVQNLRKFPKSLLQDRVNYNSLKIEDNLRQLCHLGMFNLIYVNSPASLSLIQNLHIFSSPTVCDIDQLLTYQYALENNQDVDSQDLEIEEKLLSQYSYLITSSEIQAEKLKEFAPTSSVYLIPFNNNCYPQRMNDLLQTILGEKALTFNKSKNIAILYPWGDILEEKSGASKRVGLLSKYLRDLGYNLWVFTPGETQDFYQDNIRYSYYQQSFAQVNLVNQVYKNAYQTWQNFLDFDINNNKQFDLNKEHWLPWIYYQFRFDEAFKQEIEKIANWAKVILLEYPFWAAVVGEICQQQSVKLIITAHDVLTQQLPEDYPFKKIALAEEIEGLRKGDIIVCVSPEDLAFFHDYKLEASLIPNPVDIKALEVVKNSPLNDTLFPKLRDTFCLFVGSQHLPNKEAVEKIRDIAQLDSSIQYVMVGSCCPPEETDNFLSLGKVSSEILVTLYQQATLILSPLLSGTGSSLKIIEAMAYGKVVLGTPISFRGYGVTAGIHCMIEEDFTRYPHHIYDLISHPQKRKSIEIQAQKFAQTYDYRIVYQTYQTLIEKLA